jgi:hypothetical protein
MQQIPTVFRVSTKRVVKTSRLRRHVYPVVDGARKEDRRGDSSPRWNLSFFLCFAETELADEVTIHAKAFSVEVNKLSGLKVSKSEILSNLLFSPDASYSEDLG